MKITPAGQRSRPETGLAPTSFALQQCLMAARTMDGPESPPAGNCTGLEKLVKL